MGIFVNKPIQFYVNKLHKSSQFNTTQHAKLYPQHGDRGVTIDSVTSSLQPVYKGLIEPVRWASVTALIRSTSFH